MHREFMTPYGISLDDAVRTYAPTVWANYYDSLSGNALIPSNEMTNDLWKEVQNLLQAKPYFPSEAPYSDHGFLLMWYEDDDEDTVIPSWCITSWLE